MVRGVGDFLARRPSRGSRERGARGSAFTSHMAADLDIKYLLSLARRRHELARMVCVPTFVACGHGNDAVRHSCRSCSRDAQMAARANVVVTDVQHSRPTLWMPRALRDTVEGCRKPFVVCSLGIYDERDFRAGHANALLFDVRHRVVERYEPMGRAEPVAWLDGWLGRRLEEAFPGWAYVGTALSAPARGPQATVDVYDGMCVTFSLLYVLLRLRNPDATAKEINHHIVRAHTPRQLRSIVLRLNRHVVDTLRSLPRSALE